MWEYKIIGPNFAQDGINEKDLDEWGAEGWELVSVSWHLNVHEIISAVFKRQITAVTKVKKGNKKS